MIEENGRVVAVEAGAVWVESIRQSACESCAARQGCGQSALAKLGKQHTSHVKALNVNRLDLQVGDSVIIGVPENVVMTGTLIAYMMPLITMLLAALIADSFLFQELGVVIASVLGLGLGFLLVRLHFLKITSDKRYQPTVLRLSNVIYRGTCSLETE